MPPPRKKPRGCADISSFFGRAAGPETLASDSESDGESDDVQVQPHTSNSELATLGESTESTACDGSLSVSTLPPETSSSACSSSSPCASALPPDTTPCESDNTTTTAEGPDISNFLGNDKPSDEVVSALLSSRVPAAGVAMPSKCYKDSRSPSGQISRSCKRSWFEKFDFVSFSERAGGLFCLACVLFPASGAHSGVKRADILISKPLTNWKDALADLGKHSGLFYHQQAQVRLTSFLARMKAPATAIDQRLSTQAQELVQRNRKVIASIVKCLQLCARQGIALRGHRDDSSSEALNTGNFRAIVDFRVEAGDEVLKEHLQSCSSRSTYLSKTTQNQLLTCMGDAIRDCIVADVKDAKFYSISADEVSDVSGWEQLGVVLRFVKSNKAEEKFIAFRSCASVTGEAVCKELVDLLRDVALPLADCRGQGYDGGGNMAGQHRGCQARFLAQSPRATYFHCASHQLNLALSKCANIPVVTSMVGVLSASSTSTHRRDSELWRQQSQQSMRIVVKTRSIVASSK